MEDKLSTLYIMALASESNLLIRVSGEGQLKDQLHVNAPRGKYLSFGVSPMSSCLVSSIRNKLLTQARSKFPKMLKEKNLGNATNMLILKMEHSLSVQNFF